MRPEHDPELHTIPPDRTSHEEQPQWRRDFPIDTPQDAYVARREFTKFMGLTSLAFVVGQLWIALQSQLRTARGKPPLTLVASLDELPVGGARTFHYPTANDPAILLRPADDVLLAYHSQCTHLQCPVLPQVEENKLHCPCHAGYFDLRTGAPLAGPPRRALPRITIERRGSQIYATGIEEDT